MVRLTPDEDLQFGKILEQNVGDKSFKVHWKLRTDPVGIFENDYNPDDPSEKVIHKIIIFLCLIRAWTDN